MTKALPPAELELGARRAEKGSVSVNILYKYY
jgi:hypothetical protein